MTFKTYKNLDIPFINNRHIFNIGSISIVKYALRAYPKPHPMNSRATGKCTDMNTCVYLKLESYCNNLINLLHRKSFEQKL